LKVIVHINNAAHQQQHGAWVMEGFRRHGLDVRAAAWNAPASGDLFVIWGWKQRRVIDAAKRCGTPILVMERAHLPPRMEWTSCGLSGLGNRATYAKIDDGGARWREHFGHLERPWTDRPAGYTLICGQVAGDAAIWGCDFRKWAQAASDAAAGQGRDVVYRPHPFAFKHQNDRWHPKGSRFSVAPLVEDLAGACQVVTYNSTAGVETVLAGVPTVVTDQGGMAWPMATHEVEAPLIRPDRTAWTHGLAWTGFKPHEIESGFMWDHLKGSMPCAMAA
jgi:hypothetical protein